MKNIAVIGLPRSGTSVVWDVLCRDPEIQHAIYEPLRESVLVPGALDATWRVPDEAFDIVRSSYSPAFQFMPLLIPEDCFVPSMVGYLKALFDLGPTCVKLIQLPLRARWFAQNFGSMFRIVWVVRSPMQFAASMMGNPSAWTDPSLREWFDTYELAGIGSAGTFETVYRRKQEHPYVRLLALWGMHVRHMLDLQADPAFDVARVRLEDFSTDPRASLKTIYGAEAVSSAVQRRAVHGTTEHGRKWQRGVSSENVTAHEPDIPHELLDQFIERADIADLLPRMGYASG